MEYYTNDKGEKVYVRSLSSTKGILHRIAKRKIEYLGVYRCTVDNKKTDIIAD